MSSEKKQNKKKTKKQKRKKHWEALSSDNWNDISVNISGFGILPTALQNLPILKFYSLLTITVIILKCLQALPYNAATI